MIFREPIESIPTNTRHLILISGTTGMLQGGTHHSLPVPPFIPSLPSYITVLPNDEGAVFGFHHNDNMQCFWIPIYSQTTISEQNENETMLRRADK